ncbi:DNA-binding CsgD family transcriptional regulator [Sphingomonas sp. SORGH_AS870]|uniref:helix-turn-helix transcriptional regulator n=1 Tax=Sphingomonas sp. SORGH_AS_0870 TaxID=3041801 RepID=UPI002855ED6B|nr:helix-turn-helix transcriptional regulator [Sphingomonas sp. SORGH_AS_0870]MDR6144974.1 DNA-binding CsgD family transcriptional regulator [Sphingomonas sp. SORGH_AS_0870]
MSEPPARLSPRQIECLRLVWSRRATSKEIAAELGISKSTVDKYIAEAIELTGARDRRQAAAMIFGETPILQGDGRDIIPPETPPVEWQSDSARVSGPIAEPLTTEASIGAAPFWPALGGARRLNTLSLLQTLGRIGLITVGSLAALALAMALGSGLPPVAKPVLRAFDRLTG